MELYYVITITDRAKASAMLDIHHELSFSMVLTNLGKGTATTENLALYGLEMTEKAIISTVADAESTKKLIKNAKRKMFIDIPGNGIMMAVPIKSVGGGKTLEYLADGQNLMGTKPDMQFEHELIIVILNEGYSAVSYTHLCLKQPNSRYDFDRVDEICWRTAIHTLPYKRRQS